MTQAVQLRLAEELMLLMLNEESGYLEMVPGWDFACVMAGAVIAGLSLEGRIDTDLDSLRVLDSTPTGDELLDPTLAALGGSKRSADAQYWIERIAASGADEIVNTLLHGLERKGILDHESGGFWTLSPAVSRSHSYTAEDGTTRLEAKARILNLLFEPDIPDPRDAILIGLMHACDGFRLILPPEEYDECLQRIETLTQLDLVGRSVYLSVRESAYRPLTRRVVPAKPIPKLRARDLWRQRDFRTGNIPKALHGIHKEFGSVVEMPMRRGGKRTVAVLGVEANEWVNRQGRFYLRSKDYIQGLEEIFGASRTLPGADGPEHHKLRKSLRSAYSRASLAARLPELVRHCKESIGRWQQGDVFRAAATFQDHISSQVSHLVMSLDCSEYSEELIAYEHRALITHVMGALPKFMLKTPKMRRARHHIPRLVKEIHTSHTAAQRAGLEPDIADSILKLHRTDPQLLPETDIAFPFVAAMVASIYLGSALGFAVYAMVSDPDIYEGVRREADALFGNGREPAPADFNPSSMDVTHRLFLESERMYPVIPWQFRTVMNRCEINGFELPAETQLLICQTACHYSPEHFPEPQRFDIDRYLPDRWEQTTSSAYAPYGLGTHTCLGHRWVELQVPVNLLLIAHHVNLEIEPDNYQLRINPFPTSAPNRKLKFRVTEVRNPV